MGEISYTTYKFIEPSLISEEAFYIFKDQLKLDPKSKVDLEPRVSWLSKFKISVIYYLIILPIVLYLTKDETGFWEIVGLMNIIAAIGGLFSLVPEWISYLNYLSDRDNYYRKFRKQIIESDNYDDFVIRQK